MLLHLRDDRGDHAVAVIRRDGRWLVTIDGETRDLDVRPDGRGGWLADAGAGRRRGRVAAREDERFVFAGGRTHRLQVVDPDRDDDADPAAGGPGVRADMPGKVVKVLVVEGDAVAAGRPLVILESMKMETELCAGVAGVVAKVHVADGQVVAQGDPLVDVAPATEDAEDDG